MADHGLIYDVGAHIGDDSAFYLAQGYRVVAIEANPQFATMLHIRFQQDIQNHQLVIVPYAVGATTGRSRFYVADDLTAQGSLYQERALPEWAPKDVAVKEIEVAMMPLSRIIATYGVPHYMKMDIEGGEVMALSVMHAGQFPPYISVEADSQAYLLHLLEAHGYTRFKVVHHPTMVSLTPDLRHYWVQSWIEKHASFGFYTHKQRLQRRFRYHFPFGASGPWGDHVSGPWLTRAEAHEAWHAYTVHHYNHPEYKQRPTWIDFHAVL